MRQQAYNGNSGRPFNTSADSLVPNAGRALMLKSPLFKLVVRCSEFFSAVDGVKLASPGILAWRVERFHMVGDQLREVFPRNLGRGAR